MKKITEKNVENILLETIHPEINNNLINLGMIKDIKIQEKNVSLHLVLPFLNIPIKEYLVELIEENIRKLDRNLEIKIDIIEMNNEERENFMKIAKEGWMEQ